MATSELSGKVAVVTGSARGLGEALCRTLAEDGARVVAADVRAEMNEEMVAGLCREGHSVAPLKLDLTDAEAAARAIESIRAEQGSLDVLINNAGVDVTLPIDEMAVEEWDRILAVNLRAPFVMARAVLPIMKSQRSGAIVNIASTAAKRAWANAAAYHASKWGLLGFSHALHVEARPHNVKVTAVVTGGMRTQFLFERFPDLDPGLLQDPANVAAVVRAVLLMPAEAVVPEITVIPMRETSWP